MTSPKSLPRRAGNISFVLVQLAVVSVAVGWGGSRWMALDQQRALPKLRPEPLAVTPLYDVPVVVSDEQLAATLERLRPRFQGADTKINHVDHALRFWGLEAQFADDKLLDGTQLRELLTDHRRFHAVYGSNMQPLLMDVPETGGVRVRVQAGNGSSSHVDHTMAGLAEVGTPLSFPIVTARRQATYRDMVEQAIRDFSLNQVEYEWSVLTFALFMPPERGFMTSEGQYVDFDTMARRMMREQLPKGVCFGNHRLFTLVALLRIDEQQPMLSPAVREDIFAFLGDCTQRLVAHQHADGWWDDQWPNRPASEASHGGGSGDEMVDRVLATGHALEWWAVAPESLHPPRSVLASAGQWMVRTIAEMTDEEIQARYTYLSHAGRALALWRGKRPAEAGMVEGRGAKDQGDER